MANGFSWSPNSDTNLNNEPDVPGSRWPAGLGFLCRRVPGNWGGYRGGQLARDRRLENQAIPGNFSVSCGILNGPFINTYRLNDIELDQGYYASIGAMGTWRLTLGKGGRT